MPKTPSKTTSTVSLVTTAVPKEKIIQFATSGRAALGMTNVMSLVVLTDRGRILEYAPSDEHKWRQFEGLPDPSIQLDTPARR